MERRSLITRIPDWTFNPAKRSHRFRCAACAKLIADGSELVLEKRGKRSTGFHGACFDNSFAGTAAKARDAVHLDPNRDAWSYPDRDGNYRK